MKKAEPQPPKRLRWYIVVNDKVYGPYDRPTIAQMVERSQMFDDDQVYVEGGTSWIAAKQDTHLAPLFRSGVVPPQERRERPRLTILLAGLGPVAVVAWLAWPYYAVLSVLTAVKEGDISTLERRIDWNSVRQHLKGDLNAHLLKNVAGASKGNDIDSMANGFAALLGPAVINNLVDGYVTPQAIATIARNEEQSSDSDKIADAGFKSIDQIRNVNWNQVKYAFFSGSPFAFRIDVRPRGEPTSDYPIGLEFVWNGDWRLTRVAMPVDMFREIDKSSVRAPTRTAPTKAAIPQATSAPKSNEPAPIEVALISKRFKPSDYRAGEYQEAILFELSVANRTQRAIRAFEGMLTFMDMLDNDIFSAKLTISQPIEIASSLKWTASIDYNQFKDDHKALRNEDQSNLKTKFTIRKLLFSDGSTKEYPATF